MVTESTARPQAQAGAGIDMAATVREAWAATTALVDEVDRETRQSAFMLVLESMLRHDGQDPLGNGSLEPRAVSAQWGVDDEEDLYTTPELRQYGLSDYLRINSEDVASLYSVRARAPMVQVDPLALSVSAGTVIQELALLEIAGRTAVGLDTNQTHVLSTVERYSANDREVYLPRLLACEDMQFLARPENGERLVRLTASGVTSVRALAHRIVAA